MPEPGQLFQDFVTLWVVIDPIGSIPVFIAVTATAAAGSRAKIAIQAVLVAALVLVFFAVAGQFLLDAASIPLPSFQIAGGIVLFLFALSMIFGPSKPETEIEDAQGASEKAIFPLAIPSIASPGAMLAIVVLTDNDRFDVVDQAFTVGLMLLVLAAVLVLLLLALPIHRLIGNAGASVISRVMGMILAAVAVDAVLRSFVQIGVLPEF